MNDIFESDELFCVNVNSSFSSTSNACLNIDVDFDILCDLNMISNTIL